MSWGFSYDCCEPHSFLLVTIFHIILVRRYVITMADGNNYDKREEEEEEEEDELGEAVCLATSTDTNIDAKLCIGLQGAKRCRHFRH